jgi:predicted Zn-dependent protease
MGDGQRVTMTWIADGQRVFRVTGVSGDRDWERYRPVFERTIESFRPLRPSDRDRIAERRLRVWSARAGDTLAKMLARGGAGWHVAQAAVANGIAANAQLEPGWPVKVAVSERYRGVSAPAPASR